MHRREFIGVLGGTIVSLSYLARAQQARLAHIAYLGATSATVLDPRQIEGFK